MKNYLYYVATISFITMSLAIVLDVFIAFAIFIIGMAYGIKFMEVE
ncbi:hypothetical protein LDK93_09670 [Staphylococcus pasteuri]|nr:hypothetical protein [Staphylococcus pasteuri]MCD9067296.1 hypothetical protein [Staphylococcus pasteuri]